MNNKPRTPRYWPRMKVRGARRRRLAPWQRFVHGLDCLVAALGQVEEAAASLGQALQGNDVAIATYESGQQGICRYCDISRARCNWWRGLGFTGCCPDCDHRSDDPGIDVQEGD